MRVLMDSLHHNKGVQRGWRGALRRVLTPFAEGLGVSPNSRNSLESPFAKGGLRGLDTGG
jgi:hypothetical protein